ncbi:MAG: SDR family oxidoreductase [Bacilli bacterium]|nr:SDR family oxidoreductase [Bacilli bacterium]
MEKTVLITGASRGIGAATAEVFAKHKYNIIINYYQNEQKAIDLCKKLKEAYQVKVLPIQADMSKEEDINRMILEIQKQNIVIDCLVNNAAIAIDSLFEDKTVKNFEKTIQTNLIGPFWLSKEIGKEMYQRKAGKIINITSTNGIDTFYPMSIDYDASKAALISLTHNLAVEFAPYINVNAVAPGWVKTDMNQNLDEQYEKEETEKILLKRFANPEEIANVIYFLSTEEAKYINNEVIRVDGGWYF